MLEQLLILRGIFCRLIGLDAQYRPLAQRKFEIIWIERTFRSGNGYFIAYFDDLLYVNDAIEFKSGWICSTETHKLWAIIERN